MGDPPRKGVMIVLANVGYSLGLSMLGLAALALSSWFYLALAVLAFLGLMDVVSFTARQALIQLVAPDYYRGRVGSFSSILAGLGNGTGSAVIGGVSSLAGVPGAFIINGLVCLSVTTASGLTWRGIWRHDQRTEPAAD